FRRLRGHGDHPGRVVLRADGEIVDGGREARGPRPLPPSPIHSPTPISFLPLKAYYLRCEGRAGSPPRPNQSKGIIMAVAVGIVLGSASDWPEVEPAAQLLQEWAIPFEVVVASAHRAPQRVQTYAREAAGRGLQVILAAAGMAAHLAGVLAAATT